MTHIAFRALRLLASIDFADNRFQDAANTLTKANMRHPNHPTILSMLGTVNIELNNIDKAEHFFRQAREASGNDPYISAQLAQTLLMNNKLGDAYRLLKETQEAVEQDAEFVKTLDVLLIDVFKEQNEIDKAISLAQTLSEQYPTNAEYITLQGKLLALAGKNEEALKRFEQALEFAPNFHEASVAYASTLFAQGQLQSASEYLLTQHQQFPQSTELILAIADSFRRNGQLKDAYDWSKKGYDIAPKNEAMVKNYIYANVAVGQINIAVELAKSYQLANPDEYDILHVLGELYRFDQDYSLAIATYNRAFRLTLDDGQKSETHKAIAKIYLEMNNYSGAEVEFNKAIAWQPSASLLMEFANFKRQIKQPSQAIELLTRYSEFLNKELLTVLGMSYLEAGKHGNAISTLKQVDENNIRAQVTVAQAYMQTERIDKAIRYIENKSEQQHAALLSMTLAEAYVRQENWQKASEIYQTLTEQQKSPAIFNNAAYIEIQLEEYELAKQYAMQSVALYDAQPDSLDTLGLSHYFLDEFESALPHFRKALAIDNNRADIKYHLAKTLIALERTREATVLLAESVNSKQQFEEKDEAKKLLTSLLEKS